MNILVSGGAPFIGSHVCETLLSRGDSVISIDDFNDYYDSKLRKIKLKILRIILPAIKQIPVTL